jgi:hypothetical protein
MNSLTHDMKLGDTLAITTTTTKCCVEPCLYIEYTFKDPRQTVCSTTVGEFVDFIQSLCPQYCVESTLLYLDGITHGTRNWFSNRNLPMTLSQDTCVINDERLHLDGGWLAISIDDEESNFGRYTQDAYAIL